jgi:hypothetical protein
VERPAAAGAPVGSCHFAERDAESSSSRPAPAQTIVTRCSCSNWSELLLHTTPKTSKCNTTCSGSRILRLVPHSLPAYRAAPAPSVSHCSRGPESEAPYLRPPSHLHSALTGLYPTIRMSAGSCLTTLSRGSRDIPKAPAAPAATDLSCCCSNCREMQLHATPTAGDSSCTHCLRPKLIPQPPPASRAAPADSCHTLLLQQLI